jgi:hypothetical protein
VVASDEEQLAEVVTPDFRGEHPDLTAEADDEASLEHEAYDEPVAVAEEPEDFEEPAEEAEAVVAEAEEPFDEAEPVEELSPWAARVHNWDVAAAAATAVEAPEPAPEPAYDAPETLVARADEPLADDTLADDTLADEAVADEREDVVEAPVRLQIRRPLSATPASSALEGDFVAEHDDSEGSTIFGQLRSNWLNDDESDEEAWSPNEVDRGWSAAERADDADADDTTRAGLPVRRPGGRLLPGGVSQEPSKVVRDPEAIRNRLAAHAAGVSRGRAAAAAEPITDDYAHEETGPA